MARQILGLIMIVKNESLNLPKSLAPVADSFDEAVVIDTGSSDGTADLARSMGARVFNHSWRHDFAEARNCSISKAQSDWLFWLDADNAISPRDVESLRQTIPNDGPGIIWAREKVVPGGEILWQKRCFPNHPSVGFSGRVHEQLTHPEKWPSLASPVIISHWGYVDPDKVAGKGAYYLGLLEQMLEEDPEDYYARFQAARCLKNLRQFDMARAHLEKVMQSGNARRCNSDIWLHAHLMEAELIKNTGDFKGSFNLLRNLPDQGVESGLLRYQLGRLALDMADYEAARRHLESCLRLGIQQSVVEVNQRKAIFLAHYFLADIYRRSGQESMAIQAYRGALEIDEENPGARVELSKLLISLNRHAEAEAEINRLLEVHPGNRAAKRLLSQVKEAA